MASFPKKPQRGEKVLQALYNSICQIIDYLPSLELRGDGKTTSVSHSGAGTVVHAINQPKTAQGKKGGGDYQADNVTLQLNGQVFSIKPPADTSKNYALVYVANQGIQWVEMQDC